MLDLKNKVALVTGGGRDIGGEISKKLASLGVKVCYNYFENDEKGDFQGRNGEKILQPLFHSHPSCCHVRQIISKGFLMSRQSSPGRGDEGNESRAQPEQKGSQGPNQIFSALTVINTL